jgi:hypothetical protein
MRSFSARREFAHASEAGRRGVMLRSRNRALAIYGLQVVRDISDSSFGTVKLGACSSHESDFRSGAHLLRRRSRDQLIEINVTALRKALVCWLSDESASRGSICSRNRHERRGAFALCGSRLAAERRRREFGSRAGDRVAFCNRQWISRLRLPKAVGSPILPPSWPVSSLRT